MRHLLEPILLRQLSLLEKIYRSGRIRIDDLAESFRLSTKTVMKDFSEIETIIDPEKIVSNS